MTVTIFWLSLGILTLIFLIMLLIFYTLYRREIKVKTESTAKVMGEVVAFDSQNQLLISLPVVEYQVEGERYQKNFTYAYFRETSSKSNQFCCCAFSARSFALFISSEFESDGALDSISSFNSCKV